MDRLQISVHTKGLKSPVKARGLALGEHGHVVMLQCDAATAIDATSPEHDGFAFRVNSSRPDLSFYFREAEAPLLAAAFRALAEYAESVAAHAVAPERNGAEVGL